MSILSVLLRVLLSVALLFNGVASASASGTGLVESAARADLVIDHAAKAEAMPCDEHHGAPPSTADRETGAAPLAGSLDSEPADCCESGTCPSVCAQQAPAALLYGRFTTIKLEHSDSVRPMAAGHSSPALPHLIRPPIG
ncbi:CopL family metal-binding regulatory protein [Novilysobacter erysipheiresistens]|uniref:CopL family metal-binding regulatory protein n=1 Tax=Novilysobacter erysipheiresistens TaxID=1749332 RepID=A0ABU7YXB2_9GAMM